eukprot:TRINITY_DN6137_c0_g1_i1.p1 TRINITY_DN6137_c0_g1~~TRINITY_DN6137_c0_g1_i1.p1  ORF type:complete len:1079 (+),score=262.27 TRINITY_DN6137_c0_g1_i1:107-3238(+)
MSELGSWMVVGGADRGGIIVRTECELGSPIAPQRLATGSIVKGLECHEGRLHYDLVQGQGPAKGWVTLNLRGKDLLCRMEIRAPVIEEKPLPASEESTSDGDHHQASNSDSGSSELEVVPIEACKKPDDDITADEKEALRQYEEKFGENRDGSHAAGYNRKAFPWVHPQKEAEVTSAEVIQATLAFKDKPKDKSRKPRLWDVDSDGEEVSLCGRCYMPLGEMVYEGKEKGTCVHPECMAQAVIEDMAEEDVKLQKQENDKKMKNRREYDIGWRMDSVPKNAPLAERLGCSPAPQGLTCLVFDEATRSVRVAATLEPAASINLEYLLLALKVRRQERREPLFSLDPVDPKNMEKSPQKKRYEPEWLAGTSVGDVMFQADYFLKELALGEYTQPIVGMMSVFDWSETLDLQRQWSGREWFVVKKAEVRMAEDNTLVPFVKMGVQAREQVLTDKGLEDAPVTSPNHPLKRFADAFTRNFDLIAERKSVIFHLRELAKASVLAKFLVDSGARIDSSWTDLADEIVTNTAPEAHPEIPQLWNMRGLSRIQLRDGKILDMSTGLTSNLHAIYGGVEFGLDRFELAQRNALRPGQLPGAMMQQQVGLQSMQLGPSGRPMFMPQRFQLTQRGEMPQGVDMNLDKFSLSEPERFAGSLPPCSASCDSLDARVTLGKAFLRSLREGGYANLKKEDTELLHGIFKPALADRMGEGDAFIPPDPNMSYVGKVRSLVLEEQALLKKRRAVFCDRAFIPGSAGSEFPRSWTSRFTLDHGLDAASPGVMMARKSGLVQLHVDSVFQQTLLKDVLPVAAPEFSKATEDGVIFRIYRIGSLEVRTIEEPGLGEEVGVVFSSRAPTWNIAGKQAVKQVRDDEKVVKARIYIEAIDGDTALQLDKKWSSKRLDYCHYYVVAETEDANTIVTEMLRDGTAVLALNPEGVEDRNSLAKLMLSMEDCKDMNVTVRNLQLLQMSQPQRTPEGACPSLRKHYVRKISSMLCRQVSKKEMRRKYQGRPNPYTAREGSGTSARRPYTTRKTGITTEKEEPITKHQQEEY